MNGSEPSRGGIFAAIWRFMQTALTSFHNRVELFAAEVQEETNWVVTAFLWTAVVIILGIISVLVLTATIVYLCPEDVRVYVLGAFSLLYVGITVFAIANLKRHLHNRQPPFSATIAELKKDTDCFREP